MDKNKIKKILFLRTEHLGDYGLSLPALKALREHFPKAKIDVVIGPWNLDFAKATPYIDDIIVFDNILIKRNLKYKEILKIVFREFKKFHEFFKKVNKEKYDLIFSLSDRKYNSIFLKFIKAKKKISGLSFSNPGINENLRIRRFLEMNGLGIKDYSISLKYSKSDKDKIDNLIKNMKGDKIIIHPITFLPEKNWPIEKWIKLVNNILEYKKNTKIILTGGREDLGGINKIIEKIKDKKRCYVFAGKINVIQSIYLIGKSSLIIGNDSGPVHWAELTNTKIISLFGPTDSVRWGTPKDKGKVLKGKKIEDISVDSVFSEVKKIIK